MALPLCKEDSILVIKKPFASKSYVELTLDVLKMSGIEIEVEDNTFKIKGKQKYHSINYEVEADASQSAFFFEMCGVLKKDILIQNLNPNSHQGDSVICKLFEEMGGKINKTNDGYLISCDTLHGINIDLEDCPDLGPSLFALASVCEGVTTFKHINRLRIKESDRVACMQEELSKLNIQVEDKGDIAKVYKGELNYKAPLDSHNDHRIAMAMSILALALNEEVVIKDSEAVNKSYPTFYEELERMGVKVNGTISQSNN